MKVKSRKTNADGIVRLESSGELKEILINEDFLHPNEASVALCFRGKSSSGIVELSPKEIDVLYDELRKRKHLLGNVKVMKFEK
ncbi:MAG: hypothetical protein AABX48_02500 [Nanoarchaeota archaeon]